MKSSSGKKKQAKSAEKVDAFLHSTCQSFRKITQRTHFEDDVLPRMTQHAQSDSRPRRVVAEPQNSSNGNRNHS